LKALNWHVEEDAFEDDTPYGRKHFVNVIATKDPAASRRVIVAAHFDSKYFPTFPQNQVCVLHLRRVTHMILNHAQFVGATDSAAPVAFMLDLAEALNPLLDARHVRFEAGEEADDDVADTTLQLVFFDGEEAFQDWTAKDSIYGARHLAARWAGTYVLPDHRRRLLAPQMTELDGIEHLILLDLLGAKQPLIQSSFIDTAWLFDAMADVETRLHGAGLLLAAHERETGTKAFVSWFLKRRPNQYAGHVEDDHVPFIQRGVSTLHVISNPFPRVWHTLKVSF
jgi:glutaminyl-peptide cyclotransferase